MRILISNDDGYLAPGINALAEALASVADIVVVAPDSNRSGASNSLSLDRPLSVQQAANGFYFVNGTPTDCVHVALTGMLDYRPDLVVSGINNGPNMGDDTLYSGTVAAATEGYPVRHPGDRLFPGRARLGPPRRRRPRRARHRAAPLRRTGLALAAEREHSEPAL